jgi:hypothetical protein
MSAATLEPLYSYATTPEQRADHEAAYQRWSWMTDGAVCGCCNRGRQGFTTEEFPPAFTRVSLHGAPVFDLPHKPPPSGGATGPTWFELCERAQIPVDYFKSSIPRVAERLGMDEKDVRRVFANSRKAERSRPGMSLAPLFKGEKWARLMRPPSGGAVDDGATPRPWRAEQNTVYGYGDKWTTLAQTDLDSGLPESECRANAALIVAAVNSHGRIASLEARLAALAAAGDALADAVEWLLLLVSHETGLPESAANGVTDPTGLDEGVTRASEILRETRTARDGWREARREGE